MPPAPEFDIPKRPGVYALVCDKEVVYCGSSNNVRQRVYYHFWSLRRGCHKSALLQEKYNALGEHLFSYSVLEFCCGDKEELLLCEKKWTAKYASTLLSAMPLGQPWSKDTLLRKSQIAKRQMSNVEQRAAATARCAANSKKIKERREIDNELRDKLNAASRKGALRIKEKLSDPQHLKEHSDKLRERWSDPMYKARVSESIRLAWARRKSV